MALFNIQAITPQGQLVRLRYDNSTSALSWEDGREVLPVQPAESGRAATVVDGPAAPGRKRDMRVLKISLGLSCNFSCTYCSQRFVARADETALRDVEPFLAKLPTWFNTGGENGQGGGVRVEFWGGEPLVYLKTLRPLAERLRALMPHAEFGIITNGSLLNPELNEWLDRLGFSVAVSHDGPGQHVRGPDPFADPDKMAAIRDLYDRLRPQGRFSFNAMIHRGNRSRGAVQAWFVERFGADVPLGEGTFIDPYDAGGAGLMLKPHEHEDFRRQAFHDLRTGAAQNFAVAHEKISDFLHSVRTARVAESLGQKCGMDRRDNIAVTLKGDVITCQNTSPVSKAPNGRSHKIGTVDKLDDVALDTSRHWRTRPDCAACPMLQLCKGSCMYLEGELWTLACNGAYSDAVPFFAAALEASTGCVPVRIERADGLPPLPDDREWLWGRPR